MQDPGDIMHVPEDERLTVDPTREEDPTHIALKGLEDVSDVEEGEYVSPAEYQEE